MEKKIISKELMKEAMGLSTEWNNTGYVIENKDGSLSATVYNLYKHLVPKRKIVATVNNHGFKLQDDGFTFEVDPSLLLN